MSRPVQRLKFYDRVSFKAALFAPAESQSVGAKHVAGYDSGGIVSKSEVKQHLLKNPIARATLKLPCSGDEP